MTLAGRRIDIRGTVQGVGFRPWVYRLAHESGVTGRVRNGPAGVTIEAFADEEVLDAFLADLRQDLPPAAAITELRWRAIDAEPVSGFAIAPSASEGVRSPAIPPDLATCADCLREMRDPRDRRYRYAFINCTACGPRFTIARDVPYDRATTTMAAFPMCDACRAEYESVSDRRFHAEPIACPRCGPQLAIMGASGDPLSAAASLLRQGAIVAIKGLGGYHLACDATSEEAVLRLRARKRRDAKPFAVMVRSGQGALLTSAARPIVLVPRTVELAEAVAPDAPRIGLMLPYTPLHHLLLDEVDRPLVMTSGNLSGEPIVHDDAEARTRLAGIADALLTHDRAIATPTDDSVAIVLRSRPVLVRRSRGWVPRPIAHRFAEPILACGAHLKNTFCIGTGDGAYLGPHIGDLDNLESEVAYRAAIDRMERFLRVRPEVVAHDMHPDYVSTSYALERSAIERIAVQHHHAHLASVMAEHGLDGPVIGLAYDGTGYGTDGSAWGSELLLARYDGFERLATMRPIRLAGSDTAIRQVWRIALAALDDAFDHDAPPILDIDARRIDVVRRMIATATNAPRAHGMGRLFDAVGAIVLDRWVASYEGQIAMALEKVADPSERGRYPFVIGPELDWRPMLRALVEDKRAGRSPATLAARFHNTIVAASVDLVRTALRAHGTLPVVLSGGCFQNARLVEGLARELDFYMNEQVPPNDGGIALGQAVIAAAMRKGAS